MWAVAWPALARRSSEEISPVSSDLATWEGKQPLVQAHQEVMEQALPGACCSKYREEPVTKHPSWWSGW